MTAAKSHLLIIYACIGGGSKKYIIIIKYNFLKNKEFYRQYEKYVESTLW